MTQANSNEIEIRGLIDTFVAGWNAASGGHIASAFTEEADFTAITGLHARGRDLIARAHDEILATIYKGTVLSGEVEDVYFLKPDVALVNAKFFLQKQGNSFFPGVVHTSCGITAVKNNGRWAIAVFRNMVPFARPVAGPVEHEMQNLKTA